jgi:hypothetical protein
MVEFGLKNTYFLFYGYWFAISLSKRCAMCFELFIITRNGQSRYDWLTALSLGLKHGLCTREIEHLHP